MPHIFSYPAVATLVGNSSQRPSMIGHTHRVGHLLLTLWPSRAVADGSMHTLGAGQAGAGLICAATLLFIAVVVGKARRAHAATSIALHGSPQINSTMVEPMIAESPRNEIPQQLVVSPSLRLCDLSPSESSSPCTSLSSPSTPTAEAERMDLAEQRLLVALGYDESMATDAGGLTADEIATFKASHSRHRRTPSGSRALPRYKDRSDSLPLSDIISQWQASEGGHSKSQETATLKRASKAAPSRKGAKNAKRRANCTANRKY